MKRWRHYAVHCGQQSWSTKPLALAFAVRAGVFGSLGTNQDCLESLEIREKVQYLLEHHHRPVFSGFCSDDVNENRLFLMQVWQPGVQRVGYSHANASSTCGRSQPSPVVQRDPFDLFAAPAEIPGQVAGIEVEITWFNKCCDFLPAVQCFEVVEPPAQRCHFHELLRRHWDW